MYERLHHKDKDSIYVIRRRFDSTRRYQQPSSLKIKVGHILSHASVCSSSHSHLLSFAIFRPRLRSSLFYRQYRSEFGMAIIFSIVDNTCRVSVWMDTAAHRDMYRDTMTVCLCWKLSCGCFFSLLESVVSEITTKIMQACKKPKPKKMENPPFSNFTIKVDVNKSYHGTVKKVLGSVEGVIAFKMKDSGTVIVSGFIDPDRLMSCLKKAGKNVEMVDWQFGECSNNLIVKEPPKKENEKEKEKKNEPGIEANYFYPGYYNAKEYGNGYYGYGNGHENEHWHGNGQGNGYGYGNGYGNGYGYGCGNGYGYGNGYGNGYGYNMSFPITEMSFAHKHIECSGDADDCDGHHQKAKEITDAEEDLIPIPAENNPKCCNIM